MMVDPFRYVAEAQLRSLDSPIVCVITADTIQGLARDNGGPLTDEELSVFRFAALMHCSDLLNEWLEELIEMSRDFVQREQAFDSVVANLAAAGLSDSEIGKRLEHSGSFIAERRRKGDVGMSQVSTN
jgi:hypothetical protein